MQFISNLVSDTYNAITSPISALLLTEEQKKDQGYMLSQFSTWEALSQADSCLLENETYRYKCFYVTGCLDCLPENLHKDLEEKQIVKNMLKHLLNKDSLFLLDYMKNGKNNEHLHYFYYPEEELKTACLKNNDLFELIPLNLCLYNKHKPQKNQSKKKHMSEEFWIPLAKINNTAIDYWVKENDALRETPDDRYDAFIQTKNPYFFTSAPENLKKEITLLEMFYHDKSFIKIVLESKFTLNSSVLKSLPELTNKIVFTIFDLFIKDFFYSLNQINSIYLKHNKKEDAELYESSKPRNRIKRREISTPKQIIENFENSISQIKSLDDLIHNIFLVKLKIVRCVREQKLKGRFKEITDGPFKDLELIGEIYLRDYGNDSSKLQLRYLTESEGKRWLSHVQFIQIGYSEGLMGKL